MSRFELDDQFLGHHKTVRALRKGAESLQMWLAIRTYVAINNSDGVVPDEDIDDLPGAPKNPRKWLTVLVECGRPVPVGGRGPGLVDEVEGGWRLHDYRDHGLSPDEVERRRELSRERQRRWRESRVANASRNGVTNASRDGISNPSRNASGDVPDPIRSEERSDPTENTAAEGSDRSDARTCNKRQQQPDDDKRIPCPPDLCLLDGQTANLEMLGLERWAIDQMTRELVGKFIADKPRPMSAWLKCLSKAIAGEWNAGRRPKKPDPNAPPPRSERSWMTAEEAGLPT